MSTSRIEPVVGIDLGTTYSVVAHLDSDGRPWTVLNAEGDLTTPSVVFFDKNSAIVGKEAVQAGEYEPDRLAQFAKRDMGEPEFHKEIRGEHLPAEVVQSLILKKLKADAELKLGPFTKAVITVPAFFNEPCRKATQDAGRLAGLDVLDIINEPTAAAIMYGVQQGFLNVNGESEKAESILVYDLGGGTFDVTLMHIDGASYQAVATAGDVYLGGIDWDQRIVDYFAELFEEKHGVDPRQDKCALQSLLLKAAEAKQALSARDEMTIFFNHEGKKFRHAITRQTFESLTEDLLERTLMTVRKLLRDAKKEWSDVTRLLLVGGSTRMPMVQHMLEQESGLKTDRSLSPDEAVAHGAAIYAGLATQSGDSALKGMSVTNVNSHDLGVLGIETATGRKRRQIVIPHNTPLPAKRTSKFKTFKDNQSSVSVNIVEGGDDSGQNATEIGRCLVTGLPRGLPAKTPVEVTFRYGGDGRLTVQARLPTIGKDATMEVERASGLPDANLDAWAERVNAGMPDRAGSSDGLEDLIELKD